MTLFEPVWILAVFIAALAAGRSISLLSLTMPAGMPLHVPKEACAVCHRRMSLADAIPILGYVLRRGMCPACGTAIPARQTLIELASVTIALWALFVPIGPLGFFTMVIGWWLLLIAILDAEHFWLPDRLTLPLTLFVLVSIAFLDPTRWAGHAAGSVAGYLSLVTLAYLYRRLRGREGLGGGDPKLLAAGGTLVGVAGLPTVLLWASGTALAVALGMAAFRGGLRSSDRHPFGTYLALGIWLTWLYGPIGGEAYHA